VETCQNPLRRVHLFAMTSEQVDVPMMLLDLFKHSSEIRLASEDSWEDLVEIPREHSLDIFIRWGDRIRFVELGMFDFSLIALTNSMVKKASGDDEQSHAPH
jgi:hypothetical protein